MNPPVLFALGFASLPLLYGLGAASLPIIIHLLNRRKYREVPWAAMRFLLAALRKNSRRIRVEHWLLLAVRTLLVILVVTAMAKPFLESYFPILAGKRTHRVIVLDGSLSMGYAAAETSRFAQAKDVALQLVKEARQGDMTSVVVMADPPKVIVGPPSPSAEEVRREIEPLVMPDGGTDLTASFAAIDRVLEASSLDQKEVVFLTDMQAASWRRGGRNGDDGLRRAVQKLGQRRARSVVIDLGKAGSSNRAVVDLSLGAPVVTVGPAVPVQATVRNFGPDPAPPTRVRLVVDGQVAAEQTTGELRVGEDETISFSQAFGSPGDHLVEARVDDDRLKRDDRRVLSVPVREFVRVLLVDGDYKSEPFQAETDYLAQALSPAADSAGSPSPIRVQVVAEGQLAQQELAPFDAIFLCNIAQVTPAEVSALEGYLKQGGGVVVFGGDRVSAENYNRLLHADGKGLLPAAIGPAVGDAEAKKASYEFRAKGYKNPIVADFADESDSVQAGLTSAKTWKYHKLSIPADSNARVALWFDDDAPAVVEAPRHRGRVIQVATSADTGWTTWPVHPSYPPVMERMALEAASGRLSQRNVRVGQPLDEALPPTGPATLATVRLPDSRELPGRLKPDGDVTRFGFDETDQAGAYRVRFGPPLSRESTFAANPDPAESDLAKLDRAGLADAVPGWNFDYRTDIAGIIANAASVSRKGELHRPLLYAVLALLMIESVLAHRFGHHA